MARDFLDLWWSAPVPPASSAYLDDFNMMAGCFDGDTLVAAQILEEMYGELKERVENGVKGMGLSSHPVRLFTSGSCFIHYHNFTDRKGAWLVSAGRSYPGFDCG